MKENSKRITPINLFRLFGIFTPEQNEAISRIHKILLEFILRALDANGQMGVTKSRSAFEMFELDDAVCDALSLPIKTWVMVYFDGPSPIISWEENDQQVMIGKTVAELEGNLAALDRCRGRSDLVKLL